MRAKAREQAWKDAFQQEATRRHASVQEGNGAAVPQHADVNNTELSTLPSSAEERSKQAQQVATTSCIDA